MSQSETSPDSPLDNAPLSSLVYVSASYKLMDDSELEQILRTARTTNGELEITGMLLYYDGSFMQVLEGPEANVRMIYHKITQDTRHRYIIKLLDESIVQRNFPDWSMGYQKLNQGDVESIEGFSSFSKVDQFLEYFKKSPQKSLSLLKSFRDSHRR